MNDVFQVKKPLVDDPRYDAVGSSSLREELYEAYVKTMARKSSEGTYLPSPFPLLP